MNTSYNTFLIVPCLGNCFNNVNLCEHGLTVTAKVNIAATTLNSTTPRFIIDSGAHGGQGFSLYVQSGQMYAEIAQSGKMWRVSVTMLAICFFIFIVVK